MNWILWKPVEMQSARVETRSGLGQSRHPLDQDVTVAEQAHDQAVQKFFLADHDLVDLVSELLKWPGSFGNFLFDRADV